MNGRLSARGRIDRRSSMSKHLVLAFAAMLAASTSIASAEEAPRVWPEGSAPHALQVEGRRLERARTELSGAYAGLIEVSERMRAFHPRLPDALDTQHTHWRAYVEADCRLFGAMNSAGGTWPHVHALTCEVERTVERNLLVERVDTCLQALPPDKVRFDGPECLQPLVDWTPKPLSF